MKLKCFISDNRKVFEAASFKLAAISLDIRYFKYCGFSCLRESVVVQSYQIDRSLLQVAILLHQRLLW